MYKFPFVRTIPVSHKHGRVHNSLCYQYRAKYPVMKKIAFVYGNRFVLVDDFTKVPNRY